MSTEAPLRVIHEDADLLVVDKPAGLVVHPGKSGEWSSLIGRARMHTGGRDVRLVNRLDRETSGVVVIAKHVDAAREIGRLFTAGGVRKQYLGVVHGALAGALRIAAPLGRDDASRVAIKDRVREDGAPAETGVRPRRAIAHVTGPMTLVDVEPLTGRKHQIRIHLAHAGHPIVGDKIYGPDEGIYLRFVSGAMSDEDRRVTIVAHQALHAARLAFEWRGRSWTFDAEPDEAFRRLAGIEPASPACG